MNQDLQIIASAIGAELVVCINGNDELSAFFHRNGYYVFFHYSRVGYRSTPELIGYELPACYCRTAAHANDYHGGKNYYCAYANVRELVDRLLKEEFKKA